MKVKIRTIFDHTLFNRRLLISTYLLTFLYGYYVIGHFASDEFVRWIWNGLPVLAGVWSLIIIINDIVEQRLKKNIPVLLTYAFFLSCLVGYAFHRPGTFLTLLWEIMLLCCFFPASLYIEHEEYTALLDLLFKNIVLVTTILSIASLFLFLYGKPIQITGKIILDRNNFLYGTQAFRHRYYGFFWHPGSGGIFVALSLMLIIYLFGSKKISLISFLVCFSINLIMFLMMDCRTGQIGLIVFSGLFLVGKLKTIIGKKKTYLLFTTIVIGFITVFIIRHWHEIYNGTFFTFSYLDHLSSHRFSIWKACFDEANHSPFFGDGWYNNEAVWEIGESLPSNIIAATYLYTGIVGMLIIAMLFLSSFKKINDLFHDCQNISNQIYVYICISLLVESLFEPLIIGDKSHIDTSIFWLIFGFLTFETECSVNSDTKKEIKK